jgi:hypothetical protein
VEDRVGAVQQLVQVGVDEVDLVDRCRRVVPERRHVGELRLTGVVVGETIQRQHVPAVGQEPLRQVTADETGGPGDDRPGHGCSLVSTTTGV